MEREEVQENEINTLLFYYALTSKANTAKRLAQLKAPDSDYATKTVKKIMLQNTNPMKKEHDIKIKESLIHL